MTGLKNTVLNWILWPLVTAITWATGLPQYLLSSATVTAPVAYSVQEPVTILSQAKSWFLPVLGYTIVLCLVVGVVGITVAVLRNPGMMNGKVSKRTDKSVDPMDLRVRSTKLMPLEVPEPPPVERGFGEGLRKLTRTEIPLGYTKTGEIVTWDVTQTPHIRVHGKTQGSGKTNLIKTVAVCALKAGHHVIVLDRRGFKDWRDFDGKAELIDNRREGVFSNVTSQIKALYQKRDQALGQYGAGNIEELPKKYRRVFVVISEFSTACREATADELTKVIKDLKSIMSESGATGVHLIYEAQVVNHDWPRELRGNGDPICGYLPEDTSKAGGYSYAYQLKPYEFHFDGEIFKTWDIKKYAWQVLEAVQPNGQRLILPLKKEEPVNEPDTNGGSFEPFAQVENQERTHQQKNATPVAIPPSIIRSFVRSNDWDEAAKQYFGVYPDTDHIGWCKVMALLADDGREYTAFKGGLSMRLYHSYSPNGNNYKAKG